MLTTDPPMVGVMAEQYAAGYLDGMADSLVISKAEIDQNEIMDNAYQYASTQAGSLIKEIKNQRILQSIMSRAIDEDWPDDRLQAAIGRTVGLDLRSQQALDNYEKQLVKNGTPPGKRNREVDAYARKLKQRRVATIANNERAMAYAEGKREAWRQAKSMGEISPYAVRVWRTHKDERTCPVCAPLHGRRASIDDGRGYKGGIAGPPAHVNCRCHEELVDRGTPEVP